MRRVLQFRTECGDVDGRRVRESLLIAASSLPLAVACQVGNGLREAIGTKLTAHAAVNVLEPLVPSGSAMQLLLADATVFAVEGAANEAWLIFRRASLRALIAAAFGEPIAPERTAFSAIEQRTLKRIVADIAALCTPLCGAVRSVAATNDVARIAECSSYFELVLAAPLDITVGIALARDPPEPLGARIPANAVESVPLILRAVAGSTNLTLAGLAALEIGDVLPMSKEEDAHLIAGDAIIARGTCGVSRGHAAFLVGVPGESSSA